MAGPTGTSMKQGGLLPLIAVALVLMLPITAAYDQQHDAKSHGAGPAPAGDARQLVTLPAPMAEHMLANMRDHLFALHQIHEALSRGDTDGAARIAEERLGMTSLERHGAHHMAPFMPEAMRDVGSSMHRAASQFAVSAKDAGVTGDVKLALGALAAVSNSCVSCHAGFRIR